MNNDPERLSLPHLATFAKAAELCNFTAVAKDFGLTQAAVSQRIHVLEKTLGKSLFQRRIGRTLLTEAGHQLYDHAQRILELHQEARRSLTGLDSTPCGELAIAASSIPGEYLLPALLSDFGKKYPRIRVRANIADSMAVMTQVERGEVSLGLVGQKTNNPHLLFRHFASDRIVLVVSTGHALARRKKMPIAELSGHPLVLREVGSGVRHALEKALERAGRSLADLRIVLELGSNEAIKEAVRRSAGATFLSSHAVRKEIQAGQMRAITITDLDCQREMFVVHDRRHVLPLPTRLFSIFLESHAPIGRPS